MRHLSLLILASTCFAPADGGGASAVEALGTIRAFDTGSKASEFAEGLNRAIPAIREVNGDVQRQGERIERIAAELKDLHRGAKAEAGAEWVPNGDAGKLEARYLLADGSVRFGKSIERIQLPDGSTEERVTHGLLTDPYPVIREQEAARRAYASFAVAYTRAVKMRLANGPFSDTLVRRSWLNLRSILREMPGRVGEFSRRLFESSTSDLWKRTTGVISGSSATNGTGGELLLVPQLTDIRRPMDLARRIPGLVGYKPAPSVSFKPITVTGRALARLRGATGADPARFPAQRFTTSATTIDCKDRVVQAMLDPLWTVDAAKILGDPMGFVNDWLEKGDLDTLEIWFLHADTGAQDTRATWTLGSYLAAGDLDGADTPLAFGIGWRARAADDSKTASAGGTWTPALHFARVAAMGNHGANAHIIAGIFGLLTQVASDDSFVTVDKMGDKATLVTGEVGSIGGKPVIISEFLADEFDSTNGLFTGSNTSSEFVYVDPSAYDYWELAEGADDYDAMYPERGAQYVGKVRRGVLSPNCVSGETPCALLFNV